MDYILNNKYILTEKINENLKIITYKGCYKNLSNKYIIICFKIPNIYFNLIKNEV